MKFERGKEPKDSMKIGQAAMELVVDHIEEYNKNRFGGIVDLAPAGILYLLDILSTTGLGSLPDNLSHKIFLQYGNRIVAYWSHQLVGYRLVYQAEVFRIQE